jgi:hypothetical protein
LLSHQQRYCKCEFSVAASSWFPWNAADAAGYLWNPVTNSVAINGDLSTVQLEITGSQRIYRLRK